MPKPTLTVYNKTTVCPTMDGVHCVIAVPIRSCEVRDAADKTPLQRLFMSVVACGGEARPLARRSREGLRRFGNDDAKIRRKWEWGKIIFWIREKKRIFAQKVIDMGKNDTNEPLGTTTPDEQKDVRNMENPDNYLEDRRDAFCGLGMQLDVWYDEYTKYIRHYDNSRQLNALCHIREGVSAMLNICGPIGEPKKDDILCFFGEKSDDVANLENFGRMFILERKMAWDKSVDGTPQGVPLAVVGLFYFYHALNHKIEQLRSIISYDVPFEEDGGQMEDNGKQECKKGNGPQKGSCVLPAEHVEEAPSPASLQNIPRKNVGGRPKRAGSTISKAFDYTGKDSGRLLEFYKSLKELGWIASNTDQKIFIDLFKGGEMVRKRVVWTGDVNVLTEMFRRMVNELKLVQLPQGFSIWVMVNGHFWDKTEGVEFGIERLRKTHSPIKEDLTITYLVNILDTSISITDIRQMLKSALTGDESAED